MSKTSFGTKVAFPGHRSVVHEIEKCALIQLLARQSNVSFQIITKPMMSLTRRMNHISSETKRVLQNQKK